MGAVVLARRRVSWMLAAQWIQAAWWAGALVVAGAAAAGDPGVGALGDPVVALDLEALAGAPCGRRMAPHFWVSRG